MIVVYSYINEKTSPFNTVCNGDTAYIMQPEPDLPLG